MNPQPDIQSLLDDINSILSLASGNRLPWSRAMPVDLAKQRRVLERVRDYLLHQQIVASSDISSNISSDGSIAPQLQQLISQQVRQELQNQAHGQNLESLNVGMGLEALESWGQYRPEELISKKTSSGFSDIQQQEIMSSFSALMHGLQESLHQQMQQAFTQINSQITQIRTSNPPLELSPDFLSSSPVSADPISPEDLPGLLSVKERWEKMQLLQQQSDQLLLAIDTNQRIIFETLQRHLQTYQQSLSNKLSGMYQLGMQTEVVFTTLVQQLVQQMETELAVRQKLALESTSNLSPNLAAPELLPNQSSLTPDLLDNISLTTTSFIPTSPPGLSFSPSPESLTETGSSSPQEANQDLTNEGMEMNWDILGPIPLEANAEADIDALINLNVGLSLGNDGTNLPEDIDGILASLNTPSDPFAADKDTIPDGGEELYTSLFSLEMEENDLESALFGEEILESESAIISSPEDVSWEIALFATEAPESATMATSVNSLAETEEPEIIHQLIDLIDPANRPELPVSSVPETILSADGAGDLSIDLGWGLDAELEDDRYIPAPSEESLLVPPPLEPETEISLEQDIWLQLDQDLDSFEAGISPQPRLLSEETELILSEVKVEDSPEDFPENSSLTSEIIPPENFLDSPISDELLAEDWLEAVPFQGEDIVEIEDSLESEILEVVEVEENLELEILEAVIPEIVEAEDRAHSAILEVVEAATPETIIIESRVIESTGETVPNSPSPEAPSVLSFPDNEVKEVLELTPLPPPSNFTSLDLDAEELASLEGISLGDAPQSESALIAQLLIDEALDQEIAAVNSLERYVEAILNPEDSDLIELLSEESFDRTDLENAAEGLFVEELGEFPSLRLSLSPNRLIRSEDDTLTEVPHDEDEQIRSNISNQSWQNQSSLSELNLESNLGSNLESASEVRFLDNGELLVETEANIETNYPLNLDESELMEMVWNQILDRNRAGAADSNHGGEDDRPNNPSPIEEQENGEYSSQEVLDLEIQDALNDSFSDWENFPTYVENNVANNLGTNYEMGGSTTATTAQAIASNLPNPDHYQIPQANPVSLTEINSATWYLGIDFGTTSLGAVLLNQATGELYPLYWQQGEDTSVALANSSPEQSRSNTLPIGVYGNPQNSEEVMYPVGLGVPETLAPDQMLCQNFKPYLDLGIPYWTESGWQPILRLAQNQPLVSMHWLQRATQALLRGLHSQAAATQKLRSTGITPETLVHILDSIAGVILNCPINGSDAYRWNLREAVLGAGLVSQPEQVVFIEEAIAPFLASLQIRHTKESSPSFPWRGYTLVINSGATATEFALVNSTQPQNFTHGDFGLWSFPYAGNAFDQDIICQLLLSPVTKIMQNIYETDKLLLANDLELPTAGELEITKRQRLHFWLQSSAWGQTLLIAAQNLKLHLQTKTEHRLVLGSDQWLVSQQQYESMVVIPFLQQLNQQLNNFLSITGVAEHNIFQVVCAGGTVRGSLLDEWLKIKLPQAVVIQQIGLPIGTMVAAGLASLPLYAQICNQAQQYSDYFLLMELLRILPLEMMDTPEPIYPLEEINQLLERRGINTKACSDRILDILRGELPVGLIPQLSQNIWLTTASQQHPEYLALKSAKLFTQAEQNSYQPNLEQCRRLYKYMTAMLDKTQQKLEEPLIFDLGPPQK